MKKSFLILIGIVVGVCWSVSAWGQNAWINEIHYDNDGTDTGEFIEIVLENAVSYTLSDFTIDLMNGSGEVSYDSETLDNLTVGTTYGNFTVYTWFVSGIQNGAPDGVKLTYNTTTIDYISYEGSMTGATDIGVSETGTTPVGQSLQLTGSGSQSSDFTWQAPADDTPGIINNGQSFGTTPTITLSETNLTGFTYEEGSGPSAEQSFTVSGTNLTNDITVTPPTNYYEISLSDSPWSTETSITLSPSGGTVSATTIYVRLESGLSTGTYDDEDITASSTGATSQTVECDGSVTAVGGGGACASDLIISEYIEGSSNNKYIEIYNGTGASVDLDDYDLAQYNNGSSSVSYTLSLSGTLDDGDVFVIEHSSESLGVTADLSTSVSFITFNGDDAIALRHSGTNIDIIGQIGTDPGSEWGSGLTSTSDNTLVRKSNIVAGDTNGGDAFDPSIEWDGYATDNYSDLGSHTMTCGPTITVTPSTLTGFTYSEGSGPSAEQSFTISGTNLTDDIDITPPTNYEISTGTGGAFSPTNPITLTESGGDVAETTIYVRLKSGLSAGDYNSEDITASSTDATDQTVTCSGFVCGTPSTEASSFVFSNIDVDQMDISWTSGGGESRIVLASTSPITVDPSNNTTYSASSVFGSGDDLGGGVYVIYNWTGNSLTLTGLSSSTTYYFKVFEYNCSSGHENYLTTSPLEDDETTLTQMVPVENLDVTCETTSTATIEWSDPTAGDYDGVVITIRRGSNPPFVLPDVPSAITANTTFGDASSEYGSNPDYSYIVYKGTGNSVTVTGLSENEEYSIKAFSYYNDGYDNTNAVTTTSISSLNVDDVSSATATAGNTTATLQWTLPDLCYDEILIVGHAGSSVSATPTGDGTSYTTSATFGSGTDIGSSEYVVYLNSGTNTSVTGLTNGTMYYFTIFTRNGTEWSPGIEVTVTPSNVTYFNPGELVIVGFDAAIASSSSDKIYLATFVDILPGTEFLYVNSRFEAGASANERTLRWYGGSDDITEDPGIATITYSGTGITAGSIISFEIGSGAPHTFEVNGSSNSDFSGSISSNQANISSSGGDQLWLIQGVFTDHGNYNTLDGNVLYGLTSREAWVPLSSSVSGGGTRESRIHPDIECFNLEISGTDGYAYYKNGTTGTPGTPAHDATFRTILLDIMNPANWNSAGGDGVLNITEDFCDCDQSNTSDAIGRKFCISSYTVEHQWIGDNDTDWFNCANWKGLHIPNEETDVLFDSDDCYDDIELTTQDTARCKNITFQGSGSYDFYAGGDSDKIIEIFGDININMNNSVVFDDSNSGTADGQLILHGDWINTVGDNGFKEGNSTVIFTDAQAQQITTSSGNESFDTLKIDKSAGNLTLNDNIETDYLNLTSGNINTGTNRVYISNTATGAIANSSTDSYINGNLRRDISATGSYDFPVGTASNYELINIDLQSSTGLTYLDASFDSSVGTTEISSLNLTVNGTLLQEVLDGGFWTVTPNAGVTSVDYNAGLSLRGSSNAGTEAAQHTIIKRANSGDDWAIRGNHDNDDQSISGGVVYAYRTSFNTFSDFAIAKHKTNILPVELLDFSIKCNGTENKLYWSTASELNNDYFEIQRSNDTKDWISIDKVIGAGNSNSILKYEYTDKTTSGKFYYRLKQVDYDGQFEYSEILLANCSNIAEPVIEVYPNPVLNTAKLKIANWSTDKLKIEIYDMLGKQVYQSQINLFDGYTEEKINLSKYNSGIYLIRISDGQTIENLRIEKQ